MGHLYYEDLGNLAGGPPTNTGPFINVQTNGVYWTETDYAPNITEVAWNFHFEDGRQETTYKYISSLCAWAVRDGDVIAHSHCVGTASELQAALDEAANNSTDDVIQIRQGTYYGNFSYIAEEDNSLSIEGG